MNHKNKNRLTAIWHTTVPRERMSSMNVSSIIWNKFTGGHKMRLISCLFNWILVYHKLLNHKLFCQTLITHSWFLSTVNHKPSPWQGSQPNVASTANNRPWSPWRSLAAMTPSRWTGEPRGQASLHCQNLVEIYGWMWWTGMFMHTWIQNPSKYIILIALSIKLGKKNVFKKVQNMY